MQINRTYMLTGDYWQGSDSATRNFYVTRNFRLNSMERIGTVIDDLKAQFKLDVLAITNIRELEPNGFFNRLIHKLF